MLEELHVRDLALIEDVWLEFGPGMTVLTGETGAGKTALIGALQLLVGERADAGAVRAGAAEARVEGRFSTADADLMAVRRVTADGRSKCALDGDMATVGALATRLGPLVDLHGQHEHQALLSVSTHARYLDGFAGEASVEALAAYRTAFSAYRDALQAGEQLTRRIEDARRNAEHLRFVADEISQVDPRAGEDEELQAALPALQHAERLAEVAADAAASLRGDAGALDAIAAAVSALDRVAGVDPKLDALRERLSEASALVDDTGLEIRSYSENVEHDPEALEVTLDRLGRLGGLVRKYGPTLDDVLNQRDDALAALAAYEDGEAALERSKAAIVEAEAVLRAAGAQLQECRAAAAPPFVEALAAAVEDLAMPGAGFEVAATPLSFDDWTADGPARIEFLYASAPGQPPRPLARIASGGEISRVMLALKGVLGETDTVETLVFDEIDAGIGGATAHAVGRRLAELARDHQVIVVTHLAQVAAYADVQLVVEKTLSAESASTAVRRVRDEERVAEIARMLSGNDSEASLAHARELLGEAAHQ